MTPRAFLAGSALAAALVLPSVAAAVPGYATGNVNVRTGPGTQYQVIATARAGSGVEILGCLPGRAWCDVALGNIRGWASGRYVQEAPVVVERYATPRYVRPGPSVSFSFGTSWYDDDDDWRWRDRSRRGHRNRDWDRDWGGDRDGWQGRDRPRNRQRCVDGLCGPFGK